MAPQPSALWRSVKTIQIYGANTDVGKTIMSTILSISLAKRYPSEKVWYLKPVSTGPFDEADDRHISRFAPDTISKCLYQFGEAVSPHIAARSSKPLTDQGICQEVLNYVGACSRESSGTVIVETAGGVHSPTPSGTSQADLYRPLRLPICLVADHRLGGISATISAFESLHIRGYDLHSVLQFEDAQYQNHEYLRDYFEKRGIHSLSLPTPPKRSRTKEEDLEAMSEYYENISCLDSVEELLARFAQKHKTRIRDLEGMATRANDQIWYPFTQHRELSPKTILTIDSASGDFFQAHNLLADDHLVSQQGQTSSENILEPTFDGSASWWTQGLGHGNPELSLAAAYAAGRYGHVMFAGTVHEPALFLAESLLTNLQNPRMSKVFFSDNGSTGMEVATKMALTAAFERYKWDKPKADVGIIGLKGSYHGDTIGAMDCSEPSVYNDKVHWYKGRGYWFDFPKVMAENAKWRIEIPEEIRGESSDQQTPLSSFNTLSAIFDIEARRNSPQARLYKQHISTTLNKLVLEQKMTFGAVIMEPVILGAGGMHMADPLFQHCLVDVVRNSPQLFTSPESSIASAAQDPISWSGLPVIFDEVFTGLYRLGRFTASSFLQTDPDISVHAKLLTGGLVPMCCTVASQSIYDAFLGSEKRDALLHGHSYTGHPVGCHVANVSMKAMMEMDRGDEWESFKSDWKAKGQSSDAANVDVWSAWSLDFVKELSSYQGVENVIALGSVLAVTLRDTHGGYSSTAAVGLQKHLMRGSGDGLRIHSRVLGNVLYLMASQTSKVETLRRIEGLLMDGLRDYR